MRFTFENLGPIRKASIELGDLTIIAGHNNTGKTYLAYALYGLLKKTPEMIIAGESCQEFFEDHFKKMAGLSVDKLVDTLVADGRCEWKANDQSYSEAQSKFVKSIENDFSKQYVFQIFAPPHNHLANTSLTIQLPRRPFPDKLTRSVWTNTKISFEYDTNTMSVSLLGVRRIEDLPRVDRSSNQLPIRSALLFMYSLFLVNGLSDGSFQPFILPSSRHSAPLFYKEVDYVNNQVVRRHSQLELTQENEPIQDTDPREFISQHHMPILDNVDFTRSMTRIAEMYENTPWTSPRRNTERVNLHRYIEEIMGGRYLSKNGQVRFVSNTGSKFDIPLHSASSSVWELSGLYFLLAYPVFHESSRLLIIDEPESHLDTENQIQVARLLARLANSGIKILITTHSDYIVKEINNLIMLNNDFEDKEEVYERHGYQHGDGLSPDQTRAYIADRGTLKPCKINDIGIDMPVFDNTIRNINMTARELFALTRKNAESEDEI